MCIVCTEWEKGKLTNKEALRALGEMGKEDPSHIIEVASKIMDKEVPAGTDQDADMDAEWERNKGGD